MERGRKMRKPKPKKVHQQRFKFFGEVPLSLTQVPPTACGITKTPERNYQVNTIWLICQALIKLEYVRMP